MTLNMLQLLKNSVTTDHEMKWVADRFIHEIRSRVIGDGYVNGESYDMKLQDILSICDLYLEDKIEKENKFFNVEYIDNLEGFKCITGVYSICLDKERSQYVLDTVSGVVFVPYTETLRICM